MLGCVLTTPCARNCDNVRCVAGVLSLQLITPDAGRTMTRTDTLVGMTVQCTGGQIDRRRSTVDECRATP